MAAKSTLDRVTTEIFARVMKDYLKNKERVPMYRAVGDKILVQPDEQVAEKKTSSGIYLAPSAMDKPQVGTVLNCELTYIEHGREVSMPCVEGDRVLFGKYSGVEVEDEKGKLLFLRPADILAIVE